jgi:phosphoribosylcarboxyaminoimidazole (NCAIR) mutase
MKRNTLKLPMTFGSTSDKDKVIPGIERAVREIPDLEIILNWASADNTPEKVHEIALNYARSSVAGYLVGKPWISGAGMSNVLSASLKTASDPRDLNIGIPISDSSWDGLSALLSTAEKPPLNPVLTVDINGTYAAAQIATRFLRYPRHSVFVQSATDSESDIHIRGKYDELCAWLGLLSIPYLRSTLTSYCDDIVLTVIDPLQKIPIFQLTDEYLSKGTGIQIGVMVPPTYEEKRSKQITDYQNILDHTTCSGITSVGGVANAAYLAAILTRNEAALCMIEHMKKEKADTLREAPSIVYTHRGSHNLRR